MQERTQAHTHTGTCTHTHTRTHARMHTHRHTVQSTMYRMIYMAPYIVHSICQAINKHVNKDQGWYPVPTNRQASWPARTKMYQPLTDPPTLHKSAHSSVYTHFTRGTYESPGLQSCAKWMVLGTAALGIPQLGAWHRWPHLRTCLQPHSLSHARIHSTAHG